MKLSKPPTNTELAQLLRYVAAALEIKNANRFRIISYEKAADSIEHATSEAKDLWDDHKLADLPGIGSSIATHLDEIFRTGKSTHFESELKGLPPGMFPLLDIPGVGPKTAHKLALLLGLTHEHSAITKLEKAAKQGEIQQLEGFKADGEKRILQGIEELKNRSGRTLIHHADKTANEIIEYLKKHSSVKQAYPLGSLRRRVATVGDIDLATATDKPKEVITHFIQYPLARRTVEAGDISATIALSDQSHVDLMVQGTNSFGSLLQHFTGSKHHNIHLREIALKKGWSLSEKGIKKVRSQKSEVRSFKTEEQLYKFLGLDYIPPELREDTGEIEAAQKHQLPSLINESDIKGDFHTHSNFPIEPSHDLGLNSMEEMIEQAINLNYEYLAFSEHNPSLSEHSEQQIIDLIKRKQETIIKLNEKYEKSMKTMKILNSLEIDIRPDGQLALPDKAFDYLDIAIVSIHSSFRQTRQQATDRILKALDHPTVKIWGHPTGRIINKREGLEFDWDKIFDFCVKNHKWIEIDGWPDRLDLPDTLVREAIQHGVQLTIDSDAHQIDHMEMLKYGVSCARRGWAEPKDIINTLTWKQLQKKL